MRLNKGTAMMIPSMQGQRHDFECGRGVNTVKTLQFEKGGGYMTSPTPMVAPPLLPGGQKPLNLHIIASFE